MVSKTQGWSVTRMVLLGLLGVVLLLVLLWWGSLGKKPTPAPWAVSVDAEGQVEAMGLRLGVSRLAEAMRLWQSEPELALFEDRDGRLSLEAFFSTAVFGGVPGRVVLRLQPDSLALSEIKQRAFKREPMPSGSWRWQLADQDLAVALQAFVRGMKFEPRFARLDVETVKARFGAPDAVQILASVDEEQAPKTALLYRTVAMVAVIDPDGSEYFEYVVPRDWQQLLDKMGLVR